MKRKFLLTLVVLACSATPAADPADAVRARLRLIQSGRVQPGAALIFTASELNAYARSEVPREVPAGVREPRLELGNGKATGYALIDFLKLRQTEGEQTPWLVRKLIEGEKPVKVDARLESGHGRATVFLERVEISGLGVSGSTLDFMIRTFFLPLYPDAKINEPFELSDRVDRIEVSPAQAKVVMRR